MKHPAFTQKLQTLNSVIKQQQNNYEQMRNSFCANTKHHNHIRGNCYGSHIGKRFLTETDLHGLRMSLVLIQLSTAVQIKQLTLEGALNFQRGLSRQKVSLFNK